VLRTVARSEIVKLGGTAVCVVLAAALLLGAVLFPRIEEPGRAEASGIQLNVVVGGSLNGVQNDWYLAGVERAKSLPGSLLLVSGPGPLQVVTRPLAVYDDTCYVARMRARARGSARFEFAVTDEEIRRTIASVRIPSSPHFADYAVHFDSHGYRRLAFAILGGPHGTLVVKNAALERVGGC
jgi:hypothetical protein